MGSIKVLSSVLCEEVRREATGKSILVGASPFGPNVLKDNEKRDARIAFYIEAIVDQVSRIEIRLWDKSNDNSIVESAIEVPRVDEIENDGEITTVIDEADVEVGLIIVTNFDDVHIPDPGKYTLQYSIDGGSEWEDIRDFVFPERQMTKLPS